MLKGMSVEELKNSIWKCKTGIVAVGGFPVETYEDQLERMTGTRRGYHETEAQIKEYFLSLDINGKIEFSEIEDCKYIVILNGEKYGTFDINLNVMINNR